MCNQGSVAKHASVPRRNFEQLVSCRSMVGVKARASLQRLISGRVLHARG